MHAIAIDPGDQIVTVKYRGKITIAERTEVLEELLLMFATSGCRRLLVDFFEAQSTVEEFAACKELARKLVTLGVQGCQVAYLGPRGRTINPVVDALSASRGFMFERFEDAGEARDWLRTAMA
jgi:hypothetical protein